MSTLENGKFNLKFYRSAYIPNKLPQKKSQPNNLFAPLGDDEIWEGVSKEQMEEEKAHDEHLDKIGDEIAKMLMKDAIEFSQKIRSAINSRLDEAMILPSGKKINEETGSRGGAYGLIASSIWDRLHEILIDSWQE